MKRYDIPHYSIIATPTIPPSGFWNIYPKGDGWYILNDAGQEWKLATGNISGSGAVISYTETFTPGTVNVANTITHNLGTEDVVVSLWDIDANEIVYATESNRTSNSIDITFAYNPTGDIRIVVLGAVAGMGGPVGPAGYEFYEIFTPTLLQTNFPLSNTVGAGINPLVTLNGVVQVYGTDYNIINSGTEIDWISVISVDSFDTLTIYY